jgi:hypothetical protein
MFGRLWLRSTALHAKIIAPADSNLINYPNQPLPEYEDDSRVLLLFPGKVNPFQVLVNTSSITWIKPWSECTRHWHDWPFHLRSHHCCWWYLVTSKSPSQRNVSLSLSQCYHSQSFNCLLALPISRWNSSCYHWGYLLHVQRCVWEREWRL